MVEELLNLLEKIKTAKGLDGIKVYYQSKDEVCIKGIKGDKVSKIARRHKNSHSSWDLKEKKEIETKGGYWGYGE